MDITPNTSRLIKWPLVYLLAFTSFPAGFLPVAAIGSHMEMRKEEQRSPKWRNPAKIESTRRMTYKFAWLAAAAGFIHLLLTYCAVRNWNGLLFGLRGASYCLMLWGGWLTGVVLAAWLNTYALK